MRTRKVKNELGEVSLLKFLDDSDLGPIERYQPRFVTEAQLTELYNLYHTARAALVNPTQHARMSYAAKWFHKDHPEISETAAYKDLSASVNY